MTIASAFLSQSLQVICSQILKAATHMLVLGMEHKSTDPKPAVQIAHDIRAQGIKVAHTFSLHLLGQIPTF